MSFAIYKPYGVLLSKTFERYTSTVGIALQERKFILMVVLRDFRKKIHYLKSVKIKYLKSD